MISSRVVGLLYKSSFHRVGHALKFLHKDAPDQFAAPECCGMMEYQWTEFTQQLRKAHGGKVWEFSGSVAVFCNNEFIGGEEEFLQWATDNYGYLDNRPLQFYESLAKEAYNIQVTNPERPHVFMDVCIDGELVGRLVFELYSHLCPRTCENFLVLCTGKRGMSERGMRLSYVNSLFHRVVPSGWVQGGDICGGSGAGGESIYGSTFEDECFAVPHDSSGVLGMANSGKNTNSSQFYITLSPAPWMDRQYVAFGRVVEGSSVLHRLEGVETFNERPKQSCQVSNCGVVEPLG